MSTHSLPILLIEDDDANVEIIKHLLSSVEDTSVLTQNIAFTLSTTNNLTQALEIIENHNFAAIILDLTLPDAQNFEALLTIKQKLPHIPIIVKTVDQDEGIIICAFQLGANGYIRMKDLDRNLLIYALRIAIERQQYIQSLSQKQHQVELENLENLANYIQPTITARMFASSTLKETIPDVFLELSAKYAQLLDLSLEEKIFKIDHDISDDLRNLAAKLGFLKASPRDIVDLHTKALKEKCDNANLAKIQAYVEEGRLRLLELMGYLTSYYRKYYIGLSNLNVFSISDSDIN
jgi:DNA-binding NarL/FixJ family response regulator